MLSSHVCSPSCARHIQRVATAVAASSSSSSRFSATKSRRYHQLSTVPPTPTPAPKHVAYTPRRLSDLGLRSSLPPDTLPSPDPNTPKSSDVSDQEWEIRTGRGIYVIQETLPEFFHTGLITSVDKATGAPSRPASPLLPTSNVNFLETRLVRDDEEPVYSPNCRLKYTPPMELPAPFPNTFHLEGIQLYLATSSLIRHTMNALFTDLSLTSTKLVVKTSPTSPSLSSSSSSKRRISREKSFSLRHTVSGIARVTGKQHEWEIESTYTFSPLTGLIHEHIIESIHPAPHLAVYDSLRASLAKLLGWTESGGEGMAPKLGMGSAGGASGTATVSATAAGVAVDGFEGVEATGVGRRQGSE